MYQKIKKYTPKLKSLTDVRVLGLIAFGIIALLVTWSGVKVAQTNYELAKKISVAEQRNEIAKLENENQKLKNSYYDTSLFLELSARRQFGKAAADEKLYIVPQDVAMKNTIDSSGSAKTDEQITSVSQSRFINNFNKWIDFLTK